MPVFLMFLKSRPFVIQKDGKHLVKYKVYVFSGANVTLFLSQVLVYLPSCSCYSAIPAAQQKPRKEPLSPPAYVPLCTDTSAECGATHTGSPPEQEGSAPQTPPITRNTPSHILNVPFRYLQNQNNCGNRNKLYYNLIKVLRKFFSAELCSFSLSALEKNKLTWCFGVMRNSRRLSSRAK